MLLKAEEIAGLLDHDARRDDPMVVTPELDLSELRKSGSASIDLRLGTWFVTLRQPRLAVLTVDEGQKSNVGEAAIAKTQYVPFGSDFILHPRSFVLGVTLEWIRLPKDLAAYVIGRSSWGRRGLIIATATGVHPGFTGCLTLELTNLGEIPIAIKPGMSICQLFIHRVQASADYMDQSRFIGLRRPVVGHIRLDAFAQRLAEAQLP